MFVAPQGVFGAAVTRLAAVCRLRHIHDMVRGHHHQPGPDVHERRAGRRLRGDPRPSGLSARARPVQALHTQRPVDHHQPAVRAAHVVPPAQAPPGPDQSERGGGQGGRPGHHVGKRNRQQLLGPAARAQGKCSNVVLLCFSDVTPSGRRARGGGARNNRIAQCYVIHKYYT